MEVKRFKANTIREAIGNVKNSLGPEAMILSTRKLGDGFEVTAIEGQGDIYRQSPEYMGPVRSELISIKEMIFLLGQSGRSMENIIMNPEILNLYSRIIRNGVSDNYARMFLDRAGVFSETGQTGETLKKRTIREFVKEIEVKDPFAQGNGSQAVAALAGTTGVGKTTTIAKLAAGSMLNAGKKVGLISVDNYRIGAVEQLRTYANIMGIPCFRAFCRKDLVFALGRMRDKDVVLIDTAGQSQYDLSRIRELREIITDDLGISIHLLLNVSTNEPEMNRTAINFGPLNYRSYIFTKVDEAKRCGSMINQIMKFKLPISYITTGQNVPDDIEKADKRSILKKVLNDN